MCAVAAVSILLSGGYKWCSKLGPQVANEGLVGSRAASGRREHIGLTAIEAAVETCWQV